MPMQNLGALYQGAKAWVERKRVTLAYIGSMAVIFSSAVAVIYQGVARIAAVVVGWVLIVSVIRLFFEDAPRDRRAAWFGAGAALIVMFGIWGTLYLLAPDLRPFSSTPINGRIDQALIGPEPNGSHIVIVASIANPTKDNPTIDPGSWALTVKTPGGQYVGSPLTLDNTIKLCANGWSHTFTPEDALYNKTKDGTKAFSQGVLEFGFLGVPADVLADPRNTVILTAHAIGSQGIKIEKTIAEMQSEAASHSFEIFTGLTHPNPVRCRESNG